MHGNFMYAPPHTQQTYVAIVCTMTNAFASALGSSHSQTSSLLKIYPYVPNKSEQSSGISI